MARSITSLDDVTENNLGTFKKIHTVVLPTSYSDEWYKDSLNSDQISKLAYFSELPVGALKAKLLNLTNESSFEAVTGAKLVPKMVPNVVYLETLAVLESYRHLGIGKKLLEYLEEQTKSKFIHDICLHVQVDNKEALEWYKKHGFEQKEEVKDYYKGQNLANPDAYMLVKKV